MAGKCIGLCQVELPVTTGQPGVPVPWTPEGQRLRPGTTILL